MSTDDDNSQLQLQQQQYEYYAQLHQQRLSQSLPSSNSHFEDDSAIMPLAQQQQQVQQGRSSRAQSMRPQYGDRLLDSDHLGGGGPSDVHNSSSGLPMDVYFPQEAAQQRETQQWRERAFDWIQQQVAWDQRSRKGVFVLFANLLFCLLIALLLFGMGIRHMRDTVVQDPADPKDPNSTSSQNLCAELPIFLIGTGLLLMVAITLMTLMIALVARNKRDALKRWSVTLLVALFILSSVYFVWFVIGQVWTFSTKECSTELYRTCLWTVIATYTVAFFQLVLSCFRNCCSKDILPV